MCLHFTEVPASLSWRSHARSTTRLPESHAEQLTELRSGLSGARAISLDRIPGRPRIVGDGSFWRRQQTTCNCLAHRLFVAHRSPVVERNRDPRPNNSRVCLFAQPPTRLRGVTLRNTAPTRVPVPECDEKISGARQVVSAFPAIPRSLTFA